MAAQTKIIIQCVWVFSLNMVKILGEFRRELTIEQ